ncbi:hypothetical protein PQQ63_15205 [Paraburkholderia metrosideri]|uniref:HEPN domain-containing protein n=1 Tax=Paraburkholderia metrosideri TaxID=580937 RepID=A0ABW9DSQ9_9BURK
MNIDPNKVIEAIAALKAAADELILSRSIRADDQNLAIALQCIACAAALQASCQIAGLTHRTFHTVGDLQ